MAKIVNSLQLRGTVGVEHSDERLAAVEEAKKTGQEFVSVGARGHDLVDREVLRAEVEKVSNENSSDPNDSLPDYLRELKNGVEDFIPLNQKKAAEHNDISREIVEAQDEARVKDREKLRKDPMYFANRIAEQNRQLAQDHNSRSAKFVENVSEYNENVMQEIRAVAPEAATDPDPVTALGQKAKVTDISERPAAEQLQLKDRIIYGEESYKRQAAAPLQVSPDDERVATSKREIVEPKRVEEPTRSQKKGKKGDSPAIDNASALGQVNVDQNEVAPDNIKSDGAAEDDKKD